MRFAGVAMLRLWRKRGCCLYNQACAGVAELADALDSKGKSRLMVNFAVSNKYK